MYLLYMYIISILYSYYLYMYYVFNSKTMSMVEISRLVIDSIRGVLRGSSTSRHKQQF
jgi:hypothetical protein